MMNDDLNVFGRHILPDLNPFEVYFVSASARNKYLSEDERRAYDLGRTEMFGRRTARDKDRFFRVVEELENFVKTYRTRNGMVVPEKATIIYSNINPSNTVKAYTNFQKTAFEKLSETLVNGNTSASQTYFERMDTKLMNEIQKATGTKTWIDVDFDVDTTEPVDMFHEELNNNRVRHVTIKTKSGYHVMIDRSDVHYNFHQTLVNLNSVYCDDQGEIIINSNAMIPTPGTHQGGHFVYIDWERSWRVPRASKTLDKP